MATGLHRRIEHPLSEARRSELGRYRLLNRVLGGRLAGRVCSAVYRAGLVRASSMAYYVLSTDPPVIYLGNVMPHTFEIAELLRDRKATFIKNFYMTFELPERVEELAREVDQFRAHYPQHRIHFLCSTEREQQMFHARGLEPCHFINKNCLVDEALFTVMPALPKEFDAVHNGQLAPYKRHELAAKVNSLALIVYRHARIGRNAASDEYVERIRVVLRHATWLNDVDRMIAPHEISGFLNRARVGLCLSAVEGPMAASMEYLFSGLPIVSTRSLGGRDVFFDPEYAHVVDDTPEAVARGVIEMVGRRLDPAEVRRKALAKVEEHRRRFVALVEQVLREAGAARPYGEELRRIFVNKLRIAAPFPGVFLRHISTGMPVETCRKQVRNQPS
jgi:glycosyltransferase involved in cell wall biosynthesis